MIKLTIEMSREGQPLTVPSAILTVSANNDNFSEALNNLLSNFEILNFEFDRAMLYLEVVEAYKSYVPQYAPFTLYDNGRIRAVVHKTVFKE